MGVITCDPTVSMAATSQWERDSSVGVLLMYIESFGNAGPRSEVGGLASINLGGRDELKS